jgi:hypothetical protein
MEVGGKLHVPAALTPGKMPRYSLDRRLDRLQRRSLTCWQSNHLYAEKQRDARLRIPSLYHVSLQTGIKLNSFVCDVLYNHGGWGGLDMWHAWGWGGEGRGAYRALVGRPEGKRPLGRPRRRWEDNIKMDLREMGIDGANWIRLAHDRVQWRACVNTVMNLRVP